MVQKMKLRLQATIKSAILNLRPVAVTALMYLGSKHSIKLPVVSAI